MTIKKTRCSSRPGAGYFQFLATPVDRERLAHLASAYGCTLSEAVRRSVEQTHEREVQNLMGTKLESLVEKVSVLSERVLEIPIELNKVLKRIEGGIEVTKLAEGALKSISVEARGNSATAALLLRAMVNALKSKPEIEAEITRLLQEAQCGRLPEA